MISCLHVWLSDSHLNERQVFGRLPCFADMRFPDLSLFAEALVGDGYKLIIPAPSKCSNCLDVEFLMLCSWKASPGSVCGTDFNLLSRMLLWEGLVIS